MDDQQKAAKQAFEEALKLDRYDWATRQVYADFLSDVGLDEEAEFHRTWTQQWQQAYDYVEVFCQRVDLNLEYFLGAAKKHLQSGESIDCHLNTSNSTMDEDMPLLWVNVATVLRLQEFGGHDDNPFICGGNCYPVGLTWEEHPEDGWWYEEGDRSHLPHAPEKPQE